jgi:hypothetical protein
LVFIQLNNICQISSSINDKQDTRVVEGKMTENCDNSSFGSQLKQFRENTPFFNDGKSHLTQKAFGKMVGKKIGGVAFSRDAVAKWEKGSSIISIKERYKLIAIIQVLHQIKAINIRDEADAFLLCGQYGKLIEKEAESIDPGWVVKTEPTEGKTPESTSNADENKPITVQEYVNIFNQQDHSTTNFNFNQFHAGSAPPPPSLIVGRNKDLDNLKERLENTKKDDRRFQVLTAIKGWPGVGKTTIASALAYDLEIVEKFPDGILWTSLGQAPKVLSELANWGRFIGIYEIQKSKTIEEAQNQLAAALRSKRMLLIIDDVWVTEHAIPFMVGGPGCATLITTRLDGIANSLAPTAESIYRLKELDDESALELLEKLAPSVVSKYQNECLVLVHALEGLPLALQVAGKLLNIEENSGLNVTILIEELRKGAKLLESPAPADRMDLVTQTTPTIAALLKKSIDILDQETKDYYAFLGVAAPKPATFDISMLKFIWKMEDPSLLVKNLVDRGLLEYVPELNRYQIHALLVMLARSMLTAGNDGGNFKPK